MNKSAIAIAIAASIAAIFTLFNLAGNRPDQLVSKLRKLEIGMTMSQVEINMNKDDSSNLEKWIGNIDPL